MNRFGYALTMLSLVSIVACGGGGSDAFGEGGESGSDTATSDMGSDATTASSTEEGEGEGEGGEAGSGCGNGVLELGEVCDGDQLPDQTCEDLGFVGGELACSDTCTIDATGCSEQLCGNGILEGDEECDKMDLGGVNCTDLGFGPGLPMCTQSCTFDTSTCMTLGEGDSCGGFNPCPNDLECVDGICYDGSPGDPCRTMFDCQSGSCVGATLFESGTCG